MWNRAGRGERGGQHREQQHTTTPATTTTKSTTTTTTTTSGVDGRDTAAAVTTQDAVTTTNTPKTAATATATLSPSPALRHLCSLSSGSGRRGVRGSKSKSNKKNSNSNSNNNNNTNVTQRTDLSSSTATTLAQSLTKEALAVATTMTEAQTEEPLFITATPISLDTNDIDNTINNNNVPTENEAPSTRTTTTTTMMTEEQVKKDESRAKKIAVRVVIGFTMFGFFCSSVYAGHLYVCLVVALVETMLFRELVSVRYSTYFDSNIKEKIPLFRTTQWLWFVVAMFYNYQDFFCELIQNNPKFHRLLPYVPYASSVSFALYSATLIITITTLQREHLKFQINQLCWTVVVLCLTLGQLKYIMHNIVNGLFWYVFPCCLVFWNDVMAYVCGMTMGRKFITRPFLTISPNKTWEGFLGAGLCTVIISWYFARFLAQYKWMTCPVKDLFQLVPLSSLDCDPDPVFLPAQWIFPSQLLDLLPSQLMRLMPGVVQICSTTITTATTVTIPNPSMSADSLLLSSSSSSIMDEFIHETTTTVSEILEPCVSGHENQVHHHFEFRKTKDFFPIQVHALWLALFASLVAPFGGFLASAIKRAYGLKNFAALIPGHGGVMDRFDCQLLMALCTWVYYNTFIKIATLSVPKLAYLFSLLSHSEQEDFLRLITNNNNSNNGGILAGQE